MVVGVAMELVQAPLAARHFDLLDVAADGVGAVLGVLGLWVLVRVARGRRAGAR